MLEKRDDLVSVAEEMAKNSDKEELIKWLQENIKNANKVMIIVGSPNQEDNLNIKFKNLGFEYRYEECGFMDMVVDMVHMYGEMEDIE